jgi:hypothetical protein
VEPDGREKKSVSLVQALLILVLVGGIVLALAYAYMLYAFRHDARPPSRRGVQPQSQSILLGN